MKNFSRYIAILLTLTASLLISSCNDDDDDDKPAAIERGYITDVDGNVYPTVKIGNKWWMAADLTTLHYRNGMSIMESDQDSSEWVNDTVGLYCNVEDDIHNKIGIFYNWNAVKNSNGLAPEGWHVATDEDWKELEQHLGMNANESSLSGWRGSDQGDKMKIPGPTGWREYGAVWGNNISGFSAEAKGCRMPFGTWSEPKTASTGFWWSSSSYSEHEAFYRHLDYKNSNVYRAAGSKKYGFAVRCVKD